MSNLLSYIFIDRRGRDIYSQSPRVPMIPASNMKIVTGFISMIILGDEFEIVTEFRISRDKLIVSGGPCPLLRNTEAESISEQLNGFKIKEVLFDRAFDDDLYAPGWHSENQGDCYQTRITSFSVNENCIPRSRVREGKKNDDPHTGRKIPDIRPYDTLSKILVPSSAKDVFPIFDFVESDMGKLVYTHRERLGDILQHMETISCNFSADSLFKYLHHNKTGEPGSWRGGSKVVTREISRLKLREQVLTIVDGSGLSPLNRLTPSFLSMLIRESSKFHGGNFLEYLPSPGTGTLAGRLLEFNDYGIRAKTGTLNGVANLSGYVKKLDVAFSIMLNDFYIKEREARGIIDETLADAIYKIEKHG